MVVMMAVDGKFTSGFLSKQAQVLRVPGDFSRLSFTADVAVEAEHSIGGGHYQVQIVRHHENAASALFFQPSDQSVEFRLSEVVHSLGRFVKYK